VVDHFSRSYPVRAGRRTSAPIIPADGVICRRAGLTLRILIHLVYHAQGVLCPVLLMHLAAAVETRPDRPARALRSSWPVAGNHPMGSLPAPHSSTLSAACAAARPAVLARSNGSAE